LNLALVMGVIAGADAPPSRAGIAAATGLNKATVSALVDALVEAGLVAELRRTVTGRAGRPATPLRLAGGTVAGLGLEINVDYLGVRALDLTGAHLDERIQRRDLRGSQPGRTLAALRALAGQVTAGLEARGLRLAGVTLALPGLTDAGQGPLRWAPNLGWRDVDVRRVAAGLEPAAAGPGFFTVDNEANLAALAEAHIGARQSFIYVSGEIGIGAGVVVGGQVFRGLHGWAGEIGHVPVDPAGPPCSCGARGCLEVYAGKRALLAAAGLPAAATPEDLAARLAGGRGQARAQRAIDTAAGAIGQVLAATMNLFDISTVVLGGDFTALAPALGPGIEEVLSGRVLAARWGGASLTVAASAAGHHPALTGAALAAVRRAITSPATFLP
jgi:predicted NBD/HSP70 family sugar kinase